MLINIHTDNPASRHVKMITECLMDGGVIIYPTDTVYGFGCDMYKNSAAERIARIKGIDLRNHNFSLVCKDLSEISFLTTPIPSNIFRILKRALPGPYTFILNANNSVPKIVNRKKKQIGIRIPNNIVVNEIINRLGHPMLTTSVLHDDNVIEYRTDPELIYERYKNLVDIVIDGGYGDNNPSTVIDCSSGFPEIIRLGKGEIDFI